MLLVSSVLPDGRCCLGTFASLDVIQQFGSDERNNRHASDIGNRSFVTRSGRARKWMRHWLRQSVGRRQVDQSPWYMVINLAFFVSPHRKHLKSVLSAKRNC